MSAADSTSGGVPALSRRHATGADTARALLFTVLGEFVLPGGGTAWTSALIEVLGRVGVEEKATRQALMRTAADGWLDSQRMGRRTLWRLAPVGRTLLVEGTERIYGFTATNPDWDGRWTLVLARAPETDRAARHLLRTRLSWAGFGTLAPGVWISPHADRVPPAEAVLAEVGLPDTHVFVAEHEQARTLPAMVRAAWDLPRLEAAYDEFIERFAEPADHGERADALTRIVDLVHAWRRFPWIDPVLPIELLRPGWSGARAAELFAARHAQWTEAAQAQWQALAPSVQPSATP